MGEHESRNGKIVVGRMGADDWEAETVEQGDRRKVANPDAQTLEHHGRIDDASSPTWTADSQQQPVSDPGAAQRGVTGKNDLSILPTVPREAYQIGHLIARGGMGRIYNARDLRLGRPVAIKELMTFKPTFIARFEREARITGRLQHPAIVPVYEAGVWPSGEPFYAMKLVQGESLDKVVARKETMDERLALVPEITAVSEALAYAHSHRIVHRDLKPANVLLGEFGETVVIDWGLAKDLAQSEDTEAALDESAVPEAVSSATSAPELTVYGSAMGTPSYMPPEQALGEPVDERADVYALGAILYHVLAGKPAYDDCINSDEILERVKAAPPAPLAELLPNAPADLIAIVEKAMARDPADRYPSANELAEDLKRFETGQLVSVHAYSIRSLLWRFLKRHRAVVAVATIMMLILAVFAVLSVDRIWRERNTAEYERANAKDKEREAVAAQQRAEARSQQLILLSAESALEHDPTATVAWLAELAPDEAHTATVRLLAVQARARGIAQHVFRRHDGRAYGLAFSADGAVLASSGTDGTVQVMDTQQGTALKSHYCGTKRYDIEFLPGARASDPESMWVAAAGDSGQVLLWNVVTDKHKPLEGPEDAVQYLAVSPDGTKLAASAADKTIWLWDVDSREGRLLTTTAEGWVDLAFSPDNRYLILSDVETAGIVDVSTGESVDLPPAMKGKGLVMSPDGRWVASRGQDPDVVRIWQMGTPRVFTLGGHSRVGTHMVFSPDSATLAVADGNNIRLWELAARTSRILAGHSESVSALAFSPDGRYLASGGRDSTVRVWKLDGGEQMTFHGHDAWISNLLFSPDSTQLASAGRDGTVRIWQPHAGGREFAAHKGAITHLLVTPDERRVISAGDDEGVRIWNLDKGTMRGLALYRGPVRALALSANGQVLAVSGGQDGVIHVGNPSEDIQTWNMRGDRHVELRGHKRPVQHLALSSTGKAMVSADSGGSILLWDLDTRQYRRLAPRTGNLRALVISADGRWIAGADGKVIIVWDSAGGEARQSSDHEGIVDTLAFSPDSRKLASGGRDRTVRLWDLESGERRPYYGHRDIIWKLVFSPDGRQLASGGKDGDIGLWRVGASGAGRKLEGHHLVVGELSFSSDGRLLASGSHDHTVRLWDASKESNGRIWEAGLGDAPLVLFSPGGQFLVTGASNGHIVIWPFRAPQEPEALRDWIRGLTTAELDAHDRVATP